MRRLIVAVLGALALLLIADRVAAWVVAGRVAAEIQSATGGTANVKLTGFPFLNQVFEGRYEKVVVHVNGIKTPTLRVEELNATLRGIDLPLTDLVSGVRRVPVAQVDADALVSYPDLTTAAPRDLKVSQGDAGRVRVTATVDVLGQQLKAAGDSAVVADQGDLLVTARRVLVGNQIADDVLSAAIGGRLNFRVNPQLPYGLMLTGVQVTSKGLRLQATGRDVVLTSDSSGGTG